MGLSPNQTPAVPLGLSGAPPGPPAIIAATTISLQPTGPGHMASGMDTLGIRRGPDQPHPRRSNLPDRSIDLGDGHDRYPTCSRPQESLTPAVIPFQTTVPGHLDSGGAASGLRHELPVLPGSQIGIRHGSGQFDSSIRGDVAPSPTPTLIPLPPTTNLSPRAIPSSLVSGEDAIGTQRKPSTSIFPSGDNPFLMDIQPEGTPEDPLPTSAGSPSPPLPPATLPAFQASSAAQTGLRRQSELPSKPSPQGSAGGTPLPTAATPPIGLGSRLPAKPPPPPVADLSSPPLFAASQSSSDAQTGLGFPSERLPPSLPPNLPQHPAGSVSALDTIRSRRSLPSEPLGAAAAGTSAPPLFAASQSSSDAQTGLGFPSERLPPSLPPNLPQHPAGSVSALDTIRPRRLLPSEPLGAAAAGTSAPPLFAASQSSSDAQTGLGFPSERLPPSLPPNLPQHPAGSVSALDTIRSRRLLPSEPLGAAAAGTSAPPLFAASQSSL